MHPSRDLDAAYRATAYTAATPGGAITLRIGESNATLDCLLVAAGVNSWAYITAHNPGSAPISAEENQARQRELHSAVTGYASFEGAGVGEGWPPEPSLLILGMSEEVAADVGRRFGQNAVVVGRLGGPARLLWLRRPGLQ
jgi:hypothetical protein